MLFVAMLNWRGPAKPTCVFNDLLLGHSTEYLDFILSQTAAGRDQLYGDLKKLGRRGILFDLLDRDLFRLSERTLYHYCSNP